MLNLQEHPFPMVIPVSGKLITWDHPAAIGNNFRELVNLRPHGNHKKAVGGMTKVNTSAISTYIKPRSGIHFRRTHPESGTEVIVEAWNTALNACEILRNTTAIGSQGNFSGTSLFTPSSPTLVGAFSDAPGGSIAYCNGDYSLIYGGNHLTIGSFISFNPDGSFWYDYTERVRNTTNSDAQAAVINQSTGGQDGNCLLLMHFDNAVTDAVGTHTPVNSGVTFSTTGGKFSYYGEFEAGDPDYITIPDHADFDFSGGTFTIDCWIKVESLTQRRIIFYQETDNNNYINFKVGSNGKLGLKIVSGGTEQLDSGNSFETASGIISTGTWYHVAVVENGDSWYMFCDGEIVATLTDSSRAANYTGTVNIGREVSADTRYFDGKMDELRVSNVARWTSNFTPMTEAYSANSEGHFYVGATRPLQGLEVWIRAVNTETSTMTVYYWDGSDWASVSNLSDGTSSGGVSIAQTASVTWDSTADTAKVKFIDGVMLYWYKVSISAVSSGCKVYYMGTNSPFQQIKDLWNGVTMPVFSFMMWDNSDSKYDDWTYNVYEELYDSSNDGTYADLSSMTTSDYIVFGSVSPLTALTVSIPTGKGNTTANTSATVYYWNGTAWTSVGTLDDKTSDDNISFAKTGMISWDHPGRENDFKKEIGQNIALYYYKLVFDQTLSADSYVYYIGTVPAQEEIKNFRFPMYGHNRLWLCNETGLAVNKARCSAQHTSDVWNGDDTGEYYFGNEDGLTAATNMYAQFGSNLYNMNVFFKNRETWIMIGSSPADFEPFQVSSTIGCVAPKTLATINQDIDQIGIGGRTACVFQATSGIWLFNGRGFKSLHNDIKDVFDQRSSNKINTARLDESEGWYDPINHEYHWCYASGTSTTLDREMVYDLTKAEWYEIDRGSGNYIQTAIPVMDTTGNEYIYGTIETGFMLRLENGTDFNGTAITCTLDFGDVPLLQNNWMIETKVDHLSLLMAAKATTTNDATLTHYLDAKTTGTDYTLDPTAANRLSAIPVQGAAPNTAALHRFKIVMAADDEDYAFEPISLGLLVTPMRKHYKAPA
jgi:hypothetical protein